MGLPPQQPLCPQQLLCFFGTALSFSNRSLLTTTLSYFVIPSDARDLQFFLCLWQRRGHLIL